MLQQLLKITICLLYYNKSQGSTLSNQEILYSLVTRNWFINSKEILSGG